MIDFRSACFPSVSYKGEGKDRIDRDRERTQVAFDLPVAGFYLVVIEIVVKGYALTYWYRANR